MTPRASAATPTERTRRSRPPSPRAARGISPNYREPGGINLRHGTKAMARDDAHQLEAPPWCPGRRQQRPRRCRAALSRNFPLHDDVGSQRTDGGVVEQPVKQRCGDVEGKTGNDPVGPRRQGDGVKTACMNADAMVDLELAQPTPECGRPYDILSIATTRAPVAARGIVRAPPPAPNSTTSSLRDASDASSAASSLSWRKF
jgi:hypothetical protein